MGFNSSPTSINQTERTIADLPKINAYPNPINPTTIISYTVPQGQNNKFNHTKTHVQLKVFNMLGEEVATLVNNKQKPVTYAVSFEAGNLPSGIYFCNLSADNFTKTVKLVLIR
ncbi:MAG: T9SS type A sorting domain-containing protein [Ignavibacteriae bacterium]|nr:T9SS type A sorting domain-containing protein [Ignavibacteriota bacterium]